MRQAKFETNFHHNEEDVVVTQVPVLPPFIYRSGYELSFIDLGNIGIKIEMNHPQEASGAIILPLEQADELNLWFKRRIGQMNKISQENAIRRKRVKK